MIRYFDASALVKRYVREAGTSAVGRLLAGSTPAICRLTEAEIGSALARRARAQDLSLKACDSALQRLRADLAHMHVVELTPSIVSPVHSLFSRHALRTGDGLQLAAAVALRQALETELEFVCYDERLTQAARMEGFRVRP